MNHYTRLVDSAGYTVRSCFQQTYRFELTKVAKYKSHIPGLDYVLEWHAAKPHPVTATMVMSTAALESASGQEIAAIAAERSKFDLMDRSFVKKLRAKKVLDS